MSPAKLLMLLGAGLLAAGFLTWLSQRASGPGHSLSWLGRLPGDIRIETPDFRFYFPLATGLLASVVLTALWWLFRR